jgi:hypothetical protein
MSKSIENYRRVMSYRSSNGLMLDYHFIPWIFLYPSHIAQPLVLFYQEHCKFSFRFQINRQSGILDPTHLHDLFRRKYLSGCSPTLIEVVSPASKTIESCRPGKFGAVLTRAMNSSQDSEIMMPYIFASLVAKNYQNSTVALSSRTNLITWLASERDSCEVLFFGGNDPSDTFDLSHLKTSIYIYYEWDTQSSRSSHGTTPVLIPRETRTYSFLTCDGAPASLSFSGFTKPFQGSKNIISRIVVTSGNE